MGQVYLAEHLILERLEAIKVLHPDIAAAPNFVSRFRREARASNRLQHPNVVMVYDFGKLPDGRWYLAMEYVDGTPLNKALEHDGAMPVGRALNIAHQITSGVEHAHERGVVHRDLKPHNMILTAGRGGSEVVKLLDFGVAKVISGTGSMSRLTQDGDLIGTAAYMAPESFMAPSSDPRGDIYSIGCVLYELLTGQTPYSGKLLAQMEGHTNGAIPVPSQNAAGEIPPALDTICLTCLAKSPDDRYPTASALRMALEQVASSGHASRTSMSDTAVAKTIAGSTAIADTMAGTLAYGGIHTTEVGGRGPGSHPLGAVNEYAAALRESLRELAEGLIDFNARDSNVAGMAFALAEVIAADDDAARNLRHAEQLYERELAIEQAHRERESSLRFAIGEMAFERDQAADAGQREQLEGQIHHLEDRLRRLANETDASLESLTHERVSLAAQRADIDDAQTKAYDDLQRIVDRELPKYESILEVAPLVDRYQSILSVLEAEDATLIPS